MLLWIKGSKNAPGIVPARKHNLFTMHQSGKKRNETKKWRKQNVKLQTVTLVVCLSSHLHASNVLPPIPSYPSQPPLFTQKKVFIERTLFENIFSKNSLKHLSLEWNYSNKWFSNCKNKKQNKSLMNQFTFVC